MSNPKLRLTVIFLVAVAVLIAGVVLLNNSRNSAPELVNTYEESPTAFSFRYPEGWLYQIPQVGLLILAQPETFNGEPGPTLTIYRSTQLAMEGNLEAALTAYLAQGALRPNREWELLNEITSTTFNGRDAVSVDLQGSEFPDLPQLRMRIIATRAEGFAVYIFVISAPVEEWETHRPTLENILGSVEIIE